MARTGSSLVRTALAAALSLILHVGGAGILVSYGGAAAGPAAEPRPIAWNPPALSWLTPPEPAEPPRVPEPLPVPKPVTAPEPTPPPPDTPIIRPGIDESPSDAKAWLGMAEETPHEARKFNNAQAAMTPAPGAEGQPGEPALASPPAPQPTPDPPSAQVSPTPTDTPVQPEPVSPTSAPALPTPPVDPVQTPPEDLPPDPKTSPEAPALQEPPPAPSKSGDDPPRPAPAQPTPPIKAPAELPAGRPASAPPTGSPPAPQSAPPVLAEVPASPAAVAKPGVANPGQAQGEPSETESDAGSLKEPIVVKWGKVLAGRGVEIRTAKPRWSTTALVSARPRDTLVKIVFDRTGKVVKAELMGGGSGYADVDGPLLDAISRRWRATGKRFAELNPADPKAALTLYFMIDFGA